jgi:exonuclease SbcC
MKEACRREKELRNKEVLDYAYKLSSFLSAKKKKAILEADILRNNRETEYINYMIEEVQEHLGEIKIAISEIEPKIAESRDRLIEVQSERKTIEDEYNRLLDIQKNLGKKQSGIEEKKSRITLLTMDIRKATEELRELEHRDRQALARKKEIEQEINSHKSRLSRLKEEIEVMNTTRDMLSGKMPESINFEEFPSLQGDEINIEEYVAEVKEVMKKVKDQIPTLKAQIDETHILEESLFSKKNGLQRRLEVLESNPAVNEDKDSLIMEIDSLSKQREHIAHEIEINRKKIKGIEPTLMDRENRIERERELEIDYEKRLEYLHKRKQETAAFENMEIEMERLKNKIRVFKEDAEVNKNFLDIVNKVKEHVESINMRLETALKDNHNIFNEFTYILLLAHHV